MGEAWDGDQRSADAGRTEHTRQPYRAAAPETEPEAGADAATSALPAPEKAKAVGGRAGTLDLNVPQVAGSAVAAIVAAKLASNLGVYGTIAGAGVVSVLGTCGGSILQHVFRRTGRHVHEVAAQARPATRRGRERTSPRTDAESRPPDLAVTHPLTSTDTGPAPAPAFVRDTGHAGRDGYGAPTSYRAGGRRRWKRPVVAVALAFGLTMAGITGYEAIAGENISGSGHGTTIGNAVTGHSSSHSGGSGHTVPAPGSSDTPSDGATTGPHDHDATGQPHPDTTPTSPPHRPTGTPSTGTGTSGGTHTTPPPTSPPQTPPPSTSPSATPQQTPRETQGATSGDQHQGEAPAAP